MRIGNIQLHSPFCQAGLAGYSDRAMRVVARRRGCPYAVTEALLDTILLSGGQGLRKSIDVNEEDHPVAGQIIGSDAGTMSRAAVILAQQGYDVIDLNFACPVKKVKNKARGGHMLLDAERGKDILKSLRETGVDIVWIARGAIGNPWIFAHAQSLLRGDSIRPASIHEQREALSEHFSVAMEIHGEQLAGRRMRKMGIKYSRFHPQSLDV